LGALAGAIGENCRVLSSPTSPTESIGGGFAYDAYQWMTEIGDRIRFVAASTESILGQWPWPAIPPLRMAAASCELIALCRIPQGRPDYAINTVEIGGELQKVEQRTVLQSSFCKLSL
jgi:hypothetical protein